MRRVMTLALALGLITALAAPAVAQQRQRGQRCQFAGRGQGGVGMLAENESVQKELNVEKDQADKIKEAVGKARDSHSDEFAKLQDLSQDERRTKAEELGRTVSEETLKSLADVLKPEQLKRLKQIELQQAGERAFTRPDVQAALKLTD